MSLADVTTRGFAPPAGLLALVTTRGFGQGGVVPPPPVPALPASFFGGGPFRRRWKQDEEELVRDVAQHALEGVQSAAPAPRAQEARAARVSFDLAIDQLEVEHVTLSEVREIWKKELRRRRLELEQEEATMLMMLVM